MAQDKLDTEDSDIQAFVQEVTSSLIAGKKYQISGFGTFSTCSRKDESGRIFCKVAMFRASPELRNFTAGGPPITNTGPYAEVIRYVVEKMQNEGVIDIPLLGRIACEPVKGKSAKFIFRGSVELSEAIS